MYVFPVQDINIRDLVNIYAKFIYKKRFCIFRRKYGK
jgi:hypothetical protein